MLLLCALIAGSGTVWAEETETITLSEQGYSNEQKVSSTVGTVVTLTYTDGGTPTAYYNTGNGVRVYAGGKMTVTANGSTMSKVVVTYAKNNSPTISWSSDGTNTTADTGTPATWEGSATSVDFNVSNKGHARIQSVAVTYTPAAKTDPTITFRDGSVRAGKTLDLSTLFTSNSSGAVTYSITSGGTYASIAGSVLTGVAEGSVTVKAEQEATALYNAGEATATITVEAALTLSSIAITTAPTKTTYTEGETFDATGMVVTATYSDESTDDVTALCTWSPSGALSTSDDEITISYTENGTTKTATQAITVNAYEQPNPVTIQMTNSLFGEEVHTSGTASDNFTFVGTQDRVTVTYYVPKGSYYYFNTSNTRPYNTCTLTYAAPSGYVISKIVFTSDGSNWKTATPSVGTMTENKQWEGAAGSVTFSWTDSGTRIKTVVVTLAEPATITLASACTDGTKYYGTYSNSSAFVVPADLTVTEIEVINGQLRLTNYDESEIVPANTGVMVSSETSGDHIVALTTGGTSRLGEDNLLKASGDDGVTAADMNDTDYYYYRLTMADSKPGFWWKSEDGAGFALAANKAYLKVLKTNATASARGFSLFDDETTGITSTAMQPSTGQYYDLQGRRVAQPTKGLYIVNGKKVVMK